MMSQIDWQKKSNEVFINTYGRFPAVMIEGKGCILKDQNGKEYLDFLSGIAVCSLGHCHPAVTKAIKNQAEKLVHVSNLFHTTPQTELAELLINNSFADRVFMANSGAEANEAAIKLARKHGGPDRYEIISLDGSFHGRTLACIAATGQPKLRQGFEPIPTGFINAPFNDIAALEKLIGPKTCAILCEPIQGESGVRPLDHGYLKKIRELCNKHNILLIFDEVQVGIGRTGTLFAYEQCGVTPDIITLAKALGNGLPIGAMMTTGKIASSFAPGDHASTFGGNPIGCAAGVAVLKTMLEPGFLEEVKEKSTYLSQKLQEIADKNPKIAHGVRGTGLIQGLILTPEGVELGAEIVNRMFKNGVLVNFAGNSVIRFIPPLTITTENINSLSKILNKTLKNRY
jgi:acetylornithine/N-succinyldiaminopimelate aminotransferase